MTKKENRTINRSLVVLLVVAMFAILLVGCKKPAEEPPVPSTSEVISEVVSEEVSEPVSEEVVSEEVSEEISNEVEYVNFSNYAELSEYLKKYDETTIVYCDFSEEGSPQAIIPNGGYYTIEEGKIIAIISNKAVSEVKANVNYIIIESSMVGWSIYFDTTGTDLETSFTVNYADGTSEDFTIYVTVE